MFLWASLEPERLTARAQRSLLDPYNQRYVSVASLWEMQIKHSLGKLPLPGRVPELCASWMKPLAAELLPIDVRHLGKLYELPPHHRDPFDRILIAQALSDGLEIVSADQSFQNYAAPLIW